MKYTAAVIAVIGVTILFFVGMAALAVQSPTNATLPPGNEHLFILLGFGLTSLALAAVLWLFGGRGYFASRDPAIRN